MGLIAAAVASGAGVLADQYKEYFYCPSMSSDTLVVKASKRTKGNVNRGNDNVISNGSVVAVNEGQCMIIVEQGAIVEFCAQPGEFVFDSATSPTIFTGGLWQGIKDSFEQFKKRVTMGGDAGTDQRVYYFNLKEIIGNKYGTASPVPFRVVDNNIGLDVDISIRCHGEYTYKLADPILFYKNVCGNIQDSYNRSQLDSQLKSEFLTALQPAFAEISEKGIRYSALPGHADDLAEAMNHVLSSKWGGHYGITITSVGVSSVTASEEDEKMIKELQKNAVFRNANMAGAQMVAAQSEAMVAAANNQNAGPMMAFAGMNMAGQAGGLNANQLFQMGAAQQAQAQPAQQAAPQMQPASADSWTCSCGSVNTGKFCSNCGQPRPADGVWTCSCGTQNTGKFCTNCGSPRA